MAGRWDGGMVGWPKVEGDQGEAQGDEDEVQDRQNEAQDGAQKGSRWAANGPNIGYQRPLKKHAEKVHSASISPPDLGRFWGPLGALMGPLRALLGASSGLS